MSDHNKAREIEKRDRQNVEKKSDTKASIVKKRKHPMTLNDYLQKVGLKKYKFAEQTGISGRTITRICKGHKVGAFRANLIELFTDGNVKAKDICINPEELKSFDLPGEISCPEPHHQMKFKY